MAVTNSTFGSDLELAEAAMEGDLRAGNEVGQLLLSQNLRSSLIKRGASAEEAKDIQSELANGCFSSIPERGKLYGLLAKFSGKAPLEAYLRRVALNRLISFKRKKGCEVVSINEENSEEAQVQWSQGAEFEKEDVVVEMLRSAIRRAFASVDQEQLVQLRLVQSYRLSQKKVGVMWGYSESKMSRNLAKLAEELRTLILGEVRKRDPWLNLQWNDFSSLCGESVDLFDYLD